MVAASDGAEVLVNDHTKRVRDVNRAGVPDSRRLTQPPRLVAVRLVDLLPEGCDVHVSATPLSTPAPPGPIAFVLAGSDSRLRNLCSSKAASGLELTSSRDITRWVSWLDGDRVHGTFDDLDLSESIRSATLSTRLSKLRPDSSQVLSGHRGDSGHSPARRRPTRQTEELER